MSLRKHFSPFLADVFLSSPFPRRIEKPLLFPAFRRRLPFAQCFRNESFLPSFREKPSNSPLPFLPSLRLKEAGRTEPEIDRLVPLLVKVALSKDAPFSFLFLPCQNGGAFCLPSPLFFSTSLRWFPYPLIYCKKRIFFLFRSFQRVSTFFFSSLHCRDVLFLCLLRCERGWLLATQSIGAFFPSRFSI